MDVIIEAKSVRVGISNLDGVDAVAPSVAFVYASFGAIVVSMSLFIGNSLRVRG